ncbi:MAG: toxin-antitoxin system TumE family protein [Chloroflexota bacterium]
MIDEYVQALERHIRALGKKLGGFNIVPQRREEEFAFIIGEIKFSDDTLLHFREYVELKEGEAPRRYKYAYHYQRTDETIILRHDNARHFPNLPTAPHHKHIGETEVIAANAPDLQSVLSEIEGIIGA